MTVNLRVALFATLVFSCFVPNSRAAELIPFTVTFSRSGWSVTNITGSGTLTLSNSVLRYHIVLPAVGPWRAYIRRPINPNLHQLFFFDSCLFPDSDSFCILEGDLALTERDVSNLFQGQLTLGAFFMIDSGFPQFPIVVEIEGHPVPADTDQDGVPDYLDECPGTPSGAVVSDRGCSIEQLCPCDGVWKNHGEYLKRLQAVTGEFLDDSLITEAERRAILLEAAKSDCGKR